MNSDRSRIEYIDLLRALAIIFVVLCHATEGIYQLDVKNIAGLSSASEIFCFVSFTTGRLGVPLFLMITGALLLNREYDEQKTISFWKNKWAHLLICTLIWFTIYELFLYFYQGVPVSKLQYVEDMVFVHKVNMSHVWYLPMILGVYILIPFVASVLKQYDSRLFLFPLCVFTLYAFLYPLANVVIYVCCPDATPSIQFSLGFSGGAYGLYLVYGYYLGTGALKRIRTVPLIVVSMASFASVVYMQIWSYSNGVGFNVWYDNLLLLIASVGVFEICSRLRKVYGYRVIRLVSEYAFPIFLTHNIVRSVVNDIIMSLPLIKPVQVLLLWAVCFVLGLLSSMLISRIPGIGKYVLYLK